MGDSGDSGGQRGADLIQVAFAGDLGEAEMIQGLLEGEGIASLVQPAGLDGRTVGTSLLPPGGPQRIAVHADQADAARRMLAETLVEVESGMEIDELANARHLDQAAGRGPRNYGLVGPTRGSGSGRWPRSLSPSGSSCCSASFERGGGELNRIDNLKR